MFILSMENIAAGTRDAILFPAFNLNLSEQEITAVYSSVHVRRILLDLLTGKRSIPDGRVRVNEKTLVQDRKVYFRQLGICFFDDGLYERLTVKDHFTFFSGLYQTGQTLEHVLRMTYLQDKKNVKISHLSFSEKKRVQFGRLLIQNPALFIFETPEINVDLETKRVFLQMIQELKKAGKSILMLIGNIERAVAAADRIYRLDERGLRRMEAEKDPMSDAPDQEVRQQEAERITFRKIPTKINDKIILFDPPEIDYIESSNGQSLIYIKGETFPCTFTLNELDDRLRHLGFFRCHRSYIVNLQKVREVIPWTRNSFSLILDDPAKSSVPLSKTKMVQLKDLLGLK